eukprot:4984478-Heterocapsa_arctica.AAC.1
MRHAQAPDSNSPRVCGTSDGPIQSESEPGVSTSLSLLPLFCDFCDSAIQSSQIKCPVSVPT